MAAVIPPNPNAGDLVINEFLASNTNAETDEAGQHADWVELYNNTDNALNLNGVYLTDDLAKPDKWVFPVGTSIPAKGYLIVWCDENQSQGPLHANFKISAGGEFLMLSNGAGGVIDSLTFGPQKVDTSYGRYPNGTGNFTFMPRTFNAPNSLIVKANDPMRDDMLRVFPNPASGYLTLQSGQPLGLVRVSDAFGRKVLQVDAAGANTLQLAVKNLPDGIYCLRTDDRESRLICVQR